MYYLKNLYLTEDMMIGEKAQNFKKDMQASFNVIIVPEQLDSFRDYIKNDREIIDTGMIMSYSEEILKYARALGIAALPCLKDALDAYEGFEFVLDDYADMDCDYIDKSYRRLKDIPWNIIETDRMIIREETEEDVPALYRMYESEHIKRYIEPLCEDIEDEKNYVTKYRHYVYNMYEFGIWIAEDKITHKIIGRMGLEPKTYEDNVRGVDMGYIIDAAYLRKGYCMEGCMAILEYARDTLNLPEVYVIIRTDNEISQHIAEKLGFVYDRTITDRNRTMKRYKIAFNQGI